MARASFFFATRSVAWTGERACCSGSLPGRPRDEPSRRGSEDRDRRVSRMRVRCAPVVLPTDLMGKWDQTPYTAFSAERIDDSTTPVERSRDRGARAECDRRSSRCEQHIPATRVCRFSHVGRRCVQLGVGSIRNLPNESPPRREVEAGWWCSVRSWRSRPRSVQQSQATVRCRRERTPAAPIARAARPPIPGTAVLPAARFCPAMMPSPATSL